MFSLMRCTLISQKKTHQSAIEDCKCQQVPAAFVAEGQFEITKKIKNKINNTIKVTNFLN